VNIALPTAQHDLHFSNADRQWIVTAYSLAFGSLLLLGGRIGDIVGRKRALIVGLVGFAFASAIGGASVNFLTLVIARTVACSGVEATRMSGGAFSPASPCSSVRSGEACCSSGSAMH
jgi:MFS family permease